MVFKMKKKKKIPHQIPPTENKTSSRDITLNN